MALTKIDDRGLTTPIDLLDSEKIRFGTGNDLEIYHDGTRNIIDAATSKNIDFYYNGAQQFWFGNAEFKGIDNKKIILGTHDDLQIYHDGSHNYITNAAGKVLYFYGDDFSFKNAAADETLLSFSNGYGVNLYYDNVKKLETTSTGVDIAGKLDVRDTSTTSYPFASADSGTYSYTPYAHELNLRNNTTGTDDGFAGIHFHAGERSAGGRQGTARISALYTGEYKADLVFATRNVSFAERMRITAAGQAIFKGAGTASNGAIEIQSTDPFIRLNDTNGVTDKKKWDIRAVGGSGYEQLSFRTVSDDNGTFDTKLQLLYGGDVSIDDGNLKVASGHGIDFSATSDATGSNISMDSELLDDYERGTWGSINSGADSCTFSHNWYVKVGRKVTCNIRCGGITNGNGSAFVLNLPFANGTVEASGSFACDTFNMSSDWVQMTCYAYNNKLYILCSRDNAGWENLLGNQTASNSTLIMNITYLATA